MLPGGVLNADTIRVEPALRRFIREMDKEKKPIAAICHAPWELISAGVVPGRTLTSFHTIEDDLRNAGAHWVDHEVAVDYNLVTSRSPKDLPAFNHKMIATFAWLAQPAAH
jgi:protease I